jgi:DNA topoisomerase IA
VLCVAEKPSIAKAIANHLGGQVTTVSIDARNPPVELIDVQHNIQGNLYVVETVHVSSVAPDAQSMHYLKY